MFAHCGNYLTKATKARKENLFVSNQHKENDKKRTVKELTKSSQDSRHLMLSEYSFTT